MRCTNCSTQTNNPKFCSRSCAAIYTNKLQPKKQKTKKCRNCNTLILSDRQRCAKCIEFDSKSQVLIKNNVKNANSGNYPYIRTQARKIYKGSGQPQHCIICNYSLHFDVCHIKDIEQYPNGTPLNIINDISNLLALCKNHHWEFDHEIW